MKLISMNGVGWILVAGFIMLVAGALVAPSGAYQGDLPDRRAVIEAKQSQWRLSKVFDGLAVALPAVGFVLLAILQTRQSGLGPSTVAGLAGGIAGVLGVVFAFRLAVDPIPLYDRTSPVPIALMMYGLFAVGLILFGVTFLGGSLPNWVSILMMVVPGLVLGFVMLIGGRNPMMRVGPEAGFGIGVLLFVVMLVAGIVLIRQPG